jgi:endonuclease/exonuclease/phosphatase (EEP) superfamily protein YafD
MAGMLLLAVRWGLAGALVAWTLIRVLGLDPGWPVVPLLAFTPYAALAGLVLAVVWGLHGRRGFALVAAACAAALIAVIAPRELPDRAGAGARGVRVRVLAANVAGNAAAPHSVLEDMRAWDVDVFSIVELSPAVAASYERAGIDRMLPHHELSPRPGFSGTGLYSRFPMRRLPPPSGTEFAMTSALAAPPDGAPPLELLSVHVPAPTGPGTTKQWRHDMRALPSGTRSGPVHVIAGDFNATLDHAELQRLLDRGYRDAAERAGSGLRTTWPTGRVVTPGLVTIDHVLFDRRVRVLSAKTVPISGSDHRGVLAELLLPTTG